MRGGGGRRGRGEAMAGAASRLCSCFLAKAAANGRRHGWCPPVPCQGVCVIDMTAWRACKAAAVACRHAPGETDGGGVVFVGVGGGRWSNEDFFF